MPTAPKKATKAAVVKRAKAAVAKPAKAAVVKPVVAPAVDASNDPAAPAAPVEKGVRTATTAVPRAPKAVRAYKPEKPRKQKLVRDSFTIPKAEYAVIDELKLRAAKLGQPAKKSEILRAGVMALAALTDEALSASLAGVPRMKTGRPPKV